MLRFKTTYNLTDDFFYFARLPLKLRFSFVVLKGLTSEERVCSGNECGAEAERGPEQLYARWQSGSASIMNLGSRGARVVFRFGQEKIKSN